MSEGSCEVWFYHLERSGLDEVLPELLEKTLARGWRAVIRAPHADRIEHLDGYLWTYREDSFLPHGMEGEPQAARQPILLTTRQDAPNGADALFLVDGAEFGDLAGHKRCVVLFDGRDEAVLAAARAQWVDVKRLGLAGSYWRQQARGWEKQA